MTAREQARTQVEMAEPEFGRLGPQQRRLADRVGQRTRRQVTL
ncbi:hypothetical protein ACFYYM_31225 [Streptomyces erythrochromogenes]